MQKRLIAPILLIALAALLVTGCSDSGTKSEGDITDEEFVLMKQILDEAMQSYNIETLRMALSLTDSVAVMSESAKPLFTLHKATEEVLDITELSYNYDNTNSWHIFQVTAKITATEGGDTDSLVMSGIDSLRFQADGVPSRFPVEDTTDELNIRQHYDINAYGSLGESFEFAHHASHDITGEDFDSDMFTLSGATSDSVDVAFDDYDGLTCDIFLNSDQTFNDVVFDGELDCPASGTSVVTAIVDMSCSDSTDSFTADGTWSAAFTFYGDSASVRVESGNTYWEYTEDCVPEL